MKLTKDLDLAILNNHVELVKKELSNNPNMAKLIAIKYLLIGINKVLVLFDHDESGIWNLSHVIEHMLESLPQFDLVKDEVNEDVRKEFDKLVCDIKCGDEVKTVIKGCCSRCNSY